MPAFHPKRPRSTLLTILALWAVFYASFTLFTPPLLDDADSVHAEVAREMLLRHDYITLYANGIRYLEKAPLLYWSMAACMRLSQLLGHSGPEALVTAARVPLALTILALALLLEAFARRAFANPRAGLYAALITLSSFGLFIFTRILLPDAMVCLWLTLALYAFWLTLQAPPPEPVALQAQRDAAAPFTLCVLFAASCALNVLTKGLIGLVFPLGIVTLYLLLVRGFKGTLHHFRQLHTLASLAVFLAIAAPWHILIALANPAQGHPAPITFTGGHWHVPLPTDGNVHGWLWFYFVNEQFLRYLNLRVPRDYDTVPLFVFWGLLLIWLMPWSAFLFKSALHPICASVNAYKGRAGRVFPGLRAFNTPQIFLILWAALILSFFALSTRQEYYVLPALPPLAILLAGWLVSPLTGLPSSKQPSVNAKRREIDRCLYALLTLGSLFGVIALYLLLHTGKPASSTDLAQLLQQNPADYALSFGHFLDLNPVALGLFRLPLTLAALALFLGPLASYLLRRRHHPHAATLALAAGAFLFLLAAHLGLQTFAPVLSSRRLAAAIAPQLHDDDLIVVHQEYEFASTLGFYLQRPTYTRQDSRPIAVNPIHILTDHLYNGTANYGRSSNLWYGSFFPDAPPIFETAESLAQKWRGPQRIFLWQDLANQPSPIPPLPGPVYVLAQSGGKEILSNQPNHP